MSKTLKKLTSEFNTPIHYYLSDIFLNNCLGKSVRLSYTGNIFCIQCGRKTTKSFQQGFCFPCLRRLQECDLCMIHPERCLVETGKCPENDWAHAHCHPPHIVYLANTSGLKVGITRETNMPTRWIDQGAIQALPIFSVKNRYQAGIIEVALKSFVADRTDWRRMLKNQTVQIDLLAERNRLLQQAESALIILRQQLAPSDINNTESMLFDYPVLTYPEKVNALSLEQTPIITGDLLGIKGQYLIMHNGVLNVRKFAGYEIEFEIM